MTTNYHTPITTGAAANASVVNAPMATLDAQIGILDAQVAAIFASAILSGAAVTLTNGAANAAQKVVTVDSSTAFVAGCYVEYLLVGGVLERNVVDTVDSPTQLTLITNIGTGGIANNTAIAVIPRGLYTAGVGVYNALNYGAVGNGVTDDTTAIQAALSAAGTAGNGTVLLAPGQSLITTTLVVPSNTFLQGYGYASVLKAASGLGNTAIIKTATGAVNVEMAHFRVDDTANITTHQPLWIDAAVGVKVHDIWVTNTRQAAIYSEFGSDLDICHNVINTAATLDAAIGICGSTHVTVAHNLIYASGDGIAVYGSGTPSEDDSTDVNVIGNHIRSNTGVGMSLSLGDVASMDAKTLRVVVKGNTVYASGNYGMIISGGSQNCTVEGNIFQDCVGGGILVMQGSHTVAVQNIAIQNNIIRDTAGAGIAIVTASGVGQLGIKSINIAGNTSEGNVGCGIYIVADTNDISDVTIINNHACNNDSGEAGWDGLYMRAVNTGTLERVNVIGNLFNDNQASATQRYGILLDEQASSTIKDILIAGNNLQGNRTSAMYVAAGTPSAVWRDNAGYVTYNYGVVSLADGGSITHGVAGAAPTRVNVTLSIAGEMATITSIDGTSIVVAIKKHDNSAGTTQTVYWEAQQ